MSRITHEARRMNHHRDVWNQVERKQDDLIALADRVWGMPETCYAE